MEAKKADPEVLENVKTFTEVGKNIKAVIVMATGHSIAADLNNG